MLPKGLLKEYSQALAVLIRCLDTLAIIAAGLIAYFYRFGDLVLPKQYVFALAIAAVLTLVIFSHAHVYFLLSPYLPTYSQ